MKFLFISLSAIIVSACTSDVIYKEATRDHSTHTSSESMPVLSDLILDNSNDLSLFRHAVHQAIALAHETYGNEFQREFPNRPDIERREHVAQIFADMGYEVAYYHLDSGPFRAKYPNLYLLGKPNSHEVTLIFTGTEVGSDKVDILQNFKATGYSSFVSNDPQFLGENRSSYVPEGHAGFRRAAFNLLSADFFGPLGTTSTGRRVRKTCGNESDAQRDDIVTIESFICRFNITDSNRDTPVGINVIGHSQGAGIAQMVLGIVHGLKWKSLGNEAPMNKPGDQAGVGDYNTVYRDLEYGLELKGAYLFAPPYAVYPRVIKQETGGSTCHTISDADGNSISVYENPEFQISERTVSVINFGDMVPTLWSPIKSAMHCNEGQHFGIPLMIRASGEVVIEKQNWHKVVEPHKSSNYRDLLKPD